MASRDLISALLGRDVWDCPGVCPYFDRWDLGLDPHPFGHGPPGFRHPHNRRHHHQQHHHQPMHSPFEPVFLRPRRQESTAGRSEVRNDPSKFQIQLDVSHFTPEELSVKTVNNTVVVHGKHEEKADEHGFISREFTRRYMLPPDVELENVSSSMSPDGVLTVEAPKKALEAQSAQEQNVAIKVEEKPAVKEVEDGK